MRPLDAYIVEYHHDALPWIYRAMGAKRVPVADCTMLHLDSHPDLMLPQGLRVADARAGEALHDQLSIGDWILPAVYAGHLGTIVWLRPPWARQLPEGVLHCALGADVDGELKIDCTEPYYISEMMYAPRSQLHEVRQFCIVVITLEPSSDVAEIAAKIAKHIPGDQQYLLDVDLDFFSTRDPFRALFPKAELHARLERLFCLPADDAATPAEQQQRRETLMSEAWRLFSRLQRSPDAADEAPTALATAVAALAAEVRRCYPGEPVDWELVYDAACTFDAAPLPHHVSSPEQIAAAFKQVEALLSALPAPGAVTIARSSEDEYCPSDQVDGIEQQMLAALRRRYTHVAVHVKYDTDDTAAQKGSPNAVTSAS